jgi:hypothetical protein
MDAFAADALHRPRRRNHENSPGGTIDRVSSASNEEEIMKIPPVEPSIESARPPTGDIWFSNTVLAVLLVCVLGTIVSTVLALTRLHGQPFHLDPMIDDLSKAFDGLGL